MICLIVPDCTWVYLSVPDCTWVYLSVPECTWLYLIVPDCTWLYLIVPDCTWVYLRFICFKYVVYSVPNSVGTVDPVSPVGNMGSQRKNLNKMRAFVLCPPNMLHACVRACVHINNEMDKTIFNFDFGYGYLRECFSGCTEVRAHQYSYLFRKSLVVINKMKKKKFRKIWWCDFMCSVKVL